jgi:hypothetical protein
MKYLSFVPLTLLLILSGCINPKPGYEANRRNTISIDSAYRLAVLDAQVPDKSKIYHKLTSVQRNNSDSILVVTWTDYLQYKNDSSGHYNTGTHDIWVTIVPELSLRMRHELKKHPENSVDDKLNLRLKQLIGLPEKSNYRYFAEFWVKYDDLYRPCPDNEIYDCKCGLAFPAHTDTNYIYWFNKQKTDSYSSSDISQLYPWTQLGYTYDWDPGTKSRIGLSEFIIKRKANVIYIKTTPTREYLSSILMNAK